MRSKGGKIVSKIMISCLLLNRKLQPALLSFLTSHSHGYKLQFFGDSEWKNLKHKISHSMLTSQSPNRFWGVSCSEKKNSNISPGYLAKKSPNDMFQCSFVGSACENSRRGVRTPTFWMQSILDWALIQYRRLRVCSPFLCRLEGECGRKKEIIDADIPAGGSWGCNRGCCCRESVKLP
jgi:hypothetical protein